MAPKTVINPLTEQETEEAKVYLDRDVIPFILDDESFEVWLDPTSVLDKAGRRTPRGVIYIPSLTTSVFKTTSTSKGPWEACYEFHSPSQRWISVLLDPGDGTIIRPNYTCT